MERLPSILGLLIIACAPRHAAHACDLRIGPGAPEPRVNVAAVDAAKPPAAAVADALEMVRRAEQRRIDMIARVAPAVVCIFDADRRGGGSGVIIDPDGYGLTNFHVIAGMLADPEHPRRGLGGLSDGRLYDLHVLGIDPTGDVAMFQLTGRDTFPYAALGDADAVRVGDAALAMGNPFVLSADYTPTVTAGIVTGTHRYQWGVDNQLVYTDCIQIDTPINPGNSGGPLFNDAGEVIGINGRISVNTRGRFNVGFGYAIATSQIRRFIPTLRAGLLARHGTLQATVDAVRLAPAGSPHGAGATPETSRAAGDDAEVSVVFNEVMRDAPAYDAGIRIGDRLLAFDGHPISSPNDFASVLGAYPADWPVTLLVVRGGVERRVVTRLEPLPVHLDTPFRVDADVNLTQVRRVLAQYRRAVRPERMPPASGDRPHAADGESAPHRAPDTLAEQPQPTTWIVTREYTADTGGTVQRFHVVKSRDKPVRMQERRDDGTAGMVIEYDDTQVARRTDPDGEPFDLPADLAMVYRALFTMRFRLTRPVGDLASLGVTHAGADALIRLDDAGRTAVRRPLEVIDWPLAGSAVARFAFDTQTHLVTHISVRDVPTGREAIIDLNDYRRIGGVIIPTTRRVAWRRSGRTVPAFRDTLFDGAVVSRAAVWSARGTSATASGTPHPAQQPVRAGAFDRAIDTARARVVKLYGLGAGEQPGYGSGMLVSPDGLVLTVLSLLVDADPVRAVTPDGMRVSAAVIHRDAPRQLALLRLHRPDRIGPDGRVVSDERPLPPLPYFDLAQTTTSQPGDWIIAAGNPFKVASGAEPASLAHGVVSIRTRLDARRRRRDFPYNGDVLVIDAVTSNPGAPGSAVVNIDGALVGMIGRVVIANQTHTHFNYAVPRDVLHAFLLEATATPDNVATSDNATSGSRLADADTGIRAHAATRTASSIGIALAKTGYLTVLPFVERVRRNSPAARAGVRADDLILTVNGHRLRDAKDYTDRIAALGPREPIDLVIRRGRSIITIRIEPEPGAGKTEPDHVDTAADHAPTKPAQRAPDAEPGKPKPEQGPHP